MRPLRCGLFWGAADGMVFAHSSTISVPFIFLWPKPETFEQRNWKVPALSAVNSTTTVVSLGDFLIDIKVG